MFIHMNMPDLSQWNPIGAAKLFVEEKTSRHRDVTPVNETTRRQVYFKGVFPEAKMCADVDENDDCDD